MEKISVHMYLFFVVLFISHVTIHGQNSEQTQNAPVIINSYGNCADSNLEQRVHVLEEEVARQERHLQAISETTAQDAHNYPPDCSNVSLSDRAESGIFGIRPLGTTASFQVYCKRMSGITWTVIQHRADDSTDFQRSWDSYKQGFGHLAHNFWLGLDRIHHITRQQQYKLRVELTDWENETLYAEYKYFKIGDEADGYRLQYEQYSGTAGDSLGNYHKEMLFSTFDNDNDQSESEHCASIHGGGWWYKDCDHGNLNGFYSNEPELGRHQATDNGIEWDAWKSMYSFKQTTMSVAPTFTDTL